MSRSSKKGPYVDEKLFKKVSKLNENRAKQPIKTWARACTIIPEFVGHTFEVHNGNKFLKVFVQEDMVGHKLGEFSPTRTFRGHSGKKAAVAPARRLNESEPPGLPGDELKKIEVAMAFEAKHRFARIGPRKARLLMDLVRGRDVDDALTLLRFSKQRASGMIEKVIRSAVANASEQEVATSRNTLYVAEARVDPGPVIKRFQPKDRGKAYPINKRTSHLVVSIDERGEGVTHRQKKVVGGRPGKAR